MTRFFWDISQVSSFAGFSTSHEPAHTCPISRVVSMGRRNTQLKTTYREKQTLKPLAKVSQPERYTGKILIERDPTDFLLSGTLLESMLWMVLHRPFEPAPNIRQVASGPETGM
jgi:hypothetical protein